MNTTAQTMAPSVTSDGFRPERVCRKCSSSQSAVKLYQNDTCKACLLVQFARSRRIMDAGREGRDVRAAIADLDGSRKN